MNLNGVGSPRTHDNELADLAAVTELVAMHGFGINDSIDILRTNALPHHSRERRVQTAVSCVEAGVNAQHVAHWITCDVTTETALRWQTNGWHPVYRERLDISVT